MTTQRRPFLWFIVWISSWLSGWPLVTDPFRAEAYSIHAHPAPDFNRVDGSGEGPLQVYPVPGVSNHNEVSSTVDSPLAFCLSKTIFKDCKGSALFPVHAIESQGFNATHPPFSEEIHAGESDEGADIGSDVGSLESENSMLYTQAPVPELSEDVNAPEMSPTDELDADDSLGNPALEPALDPELGILRLIEVPAESVEILDPELGVLRLQELPLTTDSSDPSVYVQVYSNFFWTDNVSSVVDDPVDDGIVQLGVSLSAFPALGDRTYLISSASADLVRYTDETNLDYNDFSFDLGVYHAFTRRAYLELGWNNDQFFDRATGDRFLNEHSFYVSVGRRDRLSPQLRLDTEYELEYNLSDPVNRNRAINEFRASLEYQITPTLETDLSYRLNLIDFTKQDRNDFYHQLILGINYDLSRDTQISLFGGGRLGDSTESFLDFNSALVGISISVNVPLF